MPRVNHGAPRMSSRGEVLRARPSPVWRAPGFDHYEADTTVQARRPNFHVKTIQHGTCWNLPGVPTCVCRT